MKVYVYRVLAGKPAAATAAGQTSLAGDVTWSRDVAAYLYTLLLVVMQLVYSQNHFSRARHTLMYAPSSCSLYILWV